MVYQLPKGGTETLGTKNQCLINDTITRVYSRLKYETFYYIVMFKVVYTYVVMILAIMMNLYEI